MKILVLNWQCVKNPSGGGAEVHMHEIFKRIVAKGGDVTLFCSRFPGSKEFETIDGIKTIRKGGRSLFNYYVRPAYKKIFSKQGFDIVVDDINKIPFYTPLFVKEPILAISHHFFGRSIFREAGPLFGGYVFAAEKLVDYAYKKTPFIVVSESTRQEFISRGFDPAQFTIAQNAFDRDSFPMKVGAKASPPAITYFGRLKKYKTVDALFRAFAILSKSFPEARLWIIGRGDFRPYLEKLARRLGIDGKTTFFGFVSDEEKIRLLSESSIVVNTSMKEGWGITNIEANACGTPVVSSDAPGLRDSVSVGKSGLLYKYNDHKELAATLENLLSDSEQLNRLSRGAVKWAKEFTWDESADIVYEKCREVVENFRN